MNEDGESDSLDEDADMPAERVLITGGAGFIGSNLAHRLLGQGHDVLIFDNLSRPGCRTNLTWLQEAHGKGSFRLITADLSETDRLTRAAEGANRVYHLAGQVAVTTSVTDPRHDFVANALGTFNTLEAARHAGDDPLFIYSSTNKVYGGLDDVAVTETESRYEFTNLPYGVSEERAIDFHSPYGCSKGAGDQYVRDYARVYGLRSIVARQSCIYGPRQFGVEDQGWVAWFIIAALVGVPITVYGNGKQVRDVLFVDDLLEFYDAATNNIAVTAGQIYNVGGGPENAMSIWADFAPMLEGLIGRPIDVRYADWRPGDQRIYVSDIRRAARDCGWRPRTSVMNGIGQLFTWVTAHKELFQTSWGRLL